ncbi:MAG: rhodanese-like domain-containing protein [Rubrobacteraceae bacterium]
MKNVKTLLVTFILSSVLLFAGCGGDTSTPDNPQDGGTFTRLSPTELQNMKNEKDFPLVNVHIPFAGNIPGTDLSIPYNEIEQNLGQLPADKDANIVLYCQGGPMSFDAAETLVGLGYTNVSDLNGGMEAWQRAGFQLKGI